MHSRKTWNQKVCSFLSEINFDHYNIYKDVRQTTQINDYISLVWKTQLFNNFFFYKRTLQQICRNPEKDKMSTEVSTMEGEGI